MSRKELVAASAEKVAGVIGIEPGTIARNDRGITLSPTQIDRLITTLTAQGYQNAIDVLSAQSESSRQEDSASGLHMYAVYKAGASFLEGVR